MSVDEIRGLALGKVPMHYKQAADELGACRDKIESGKIDIEIKVKGADNGK